VQLPQERAKTFFDTLYQLHIAAIKPRAAPTRPAASGAPSAAANAKASRGAATSPAARGTAQEAPVQAAKADTTPREDEAAVETGGFSGTDNYHDYVSEIAVGTWLAFRAGNEWINARLTWISPLRTKYIFTSRSRTSAFVYSPEELAWELATGRTRLVVEPVPLFDRAVSAALDSIAAQKAATA
jgi:hypothetical protein